MIYHTATRVETSKSIIATPLFMAGVKAMKIPELWHSYSHEDKPRIKRTNLLLVVGAAIACILWSTAVVIIVAR